MIRSLRLRIFLTVWPLVVAAVVVVALFFGRWTRVELERFQDVRVGEAADGPRRVLADSIAAGWRATGAPDGDRLRRLAAGIGAGDAALVVLDTTGRLVAASDSGVRPRDVQRAPDGTLELTRRVRQGPLLHEVVVRVAGAPLADAAARPLGRLYVVRPTPPGDAADGELPAPPAPLAGAQRAIWRAVVLASIAAAVATLLLARPIVGQVGRLADAARRIRQGELRARVRPSSADELGELERSFNDMAASLERAEALKRRMISDVSHELRTPLTNIIGLLEAVRDGLRAPDAATLESAREEALLLHALVEELQELSLAEAGALRFDVETVDAAVEVRRAVEASRAAGTDGARVEPYAAQAAAPVRADRRRLGQVLRNLLRNAAMHTPADGRVWVEVEPRGAEVEIRVRDTGCGIPAAELPLVWERFYRLDPSRDRASGGMGLGLAVVRHLVQGMGGRVRAESVEGRGSTFAIVLPAAGP